MAMREIGEVGQTAKETVFLGPTVSSEQLIKFTVMTAERLRKEVFDASGDDAVKRKAANTILSEMTKGVASDIDGLDKKIEASANKDQTLVLAREVLANSTYLLLRDGGNATAKGALMSGVTSQIEGVLPSPLKVLAREVRNRVITNTEVASAIDQIDAAAVENMWGLLPPSPRERIEVLNGSLERLKNLGNNIQINHPDRQQYNRAFIFLRAQIASLREEMAGGGQPGVAAEEIRKLREDEQRRADEKRGEETAMYQAEMEARNEHENGMKLKYFKAMFINPTPDSPQIGGTLAPEWQKQLPNDVALKVIELNNSAYVLTTSAGIEDWLQYLFRSPDKVMDEFFNKQPGMKWLAQDMLQRYFEPVPGATSEEHFNLRFKGKWVFANDPNRDNKRDWRASDGIKNKEWKVAQEVKEDFENLDKLFETYSKELIRRNLVIGKTEKEKEANAAMVLGIWGSLLRVSLLTDDANPSGSYDINTFMNQTWKANYPEAKGLSKYDKSSPFADQFGDWLRRRKTSASDPKSFTHVLDQQFMDQWLNRNKIHPLPERLLVNFFSWNKVEIASGPFADKTDKNGKPLKICMLKALYEGWTMDFSNKGNDNWIKYHDVVRSAAGIFGYIGGSSKEAPIIFGKTDPGEWVLGLEKKYVYLRDKDDLPELQEEFRNTRNQGEDHSPWAERIMWLMGACAGGFVDSPDLVIYQAATEKWPQPVNIKKLLNSDPMVNMLDQKDRDWISEKLHVVYNERATMIQREIEKSQKQRIAIVRKAKNTKPTFGERFKPPTIG